jgi:hypothetical protein
VLVVDATVVVVAIDVVVDARLVVVVVWMVVVDVRQPPVGLQTSTSFWTLPPPADAEMTHLPSRSPFFFLRTLMVAVSPQTEESGEGVTRSLPTGPQ